MNILKKIAVTITAIGVTFDASADANVLDQSVFNFDVTLTEGIGPNPGSFGEPTVSQTFTAGEQLAIILYSSEFNPNTIFSYAGSSLDSYTDGGLLLYTGGGWFGDNSGNDLFFKTFVTVPECCKRLLWRGRSTRNSTGQRCLGANRPWLSCGRSERV